jgi:hypothetical protein
MTNNIPGTVPENIIAQIKAEVDEVQAFEQIERDAQTSMFEAKKTAFEHKCACGKLLIEAKRIHGVDGKWRAWLKVNFPLSYKTADEWMEYVKYHDKIIAAAPDKPPIIDDDATPDDVKRASHFSWRGLRELIKKDKEKENPDAPKKTRRAVTAKKPKTIDDQLRNHLAELVPDEVLAALEDLWEWPLVLKLAEQIVDRDTARQAKEGA